MMEHIESGLLKYYKTTEPQYFDMSRSKNLALKLSTGDICCMIDADNFAGPDYAHWVNRVFSEKGKNSIITTIRSNYIPLRDQGGKICLHKDMLNMVRGFDESFQGYGIEDVDLIFRLEKKGGTRIYINDETHLQAIEHSEKERLVNFYLINNLEILYQDTSNPSSSKRKLLYLMKNNSFMSVTFFYDEVLKQSQMLTHDGWYTDEEEIRRGEWNRFDSGIQLIYENSKTINFEGRSPNQLVSFANGSKALLNEITKDDKLYEWYLIIVGECFNRLKMIKNYEIKELINPNAWGKGNVYLNFQDQINSIS